MRLQLAEEVCANLENYPPEFLSAKHGYEMALAVERKARSHLELQQYEQARQTYQEAINVYPRLRNVDENQKQSGIAAGYHQLGMVAEELREYEQARSHYQQALDIKIEYNDRYSQART